MSSFHCFPNLPTELRIEVWRHHFSVCHGPQIHMFVSSPDTNPTPTSQPRYISLDAATNLQGYDTLGAAKVSSEAWLVFNELFIIGDTRCLSPHNSLLDSDGKLIDHDPTKDHSGGSMRGLYAQAVQEDLRQHTVRFALDCKHDLIYIVGGNIHPLFRALCSSSWIHKVTQVALQMLSLEAEHQPMTSMFGRRALWTETLENPSPDVQRFMNNTNLKDMYHVVFPDQQSDLGALKLENIWGFIRIGARSYVPMASEREAIRISSYITDFVFEKHFPRVASKDLKLHYVLDAIPIHARLASSSTINPL